MRRASQWFLILAISLGLFLPAAVVPPAAAAAPTDLFFSEYIEGSSNNKALEIYNGTGAAVDLAAGGYNVQMFFNGSASAGLTINLTGTVADGDVYVVAQSSANATILAQADQTNGAGWFNGDDAVVLRKGTTVLDVIGQIGFDPGSQWGVDLVSTADNTLRRKADVCAGDTDGSNAFDPAVEWDGYAIDTFDGLGAHMASCGGVVADSAPLVASSSPVNGDASFPVGSNITVTFSEPVNVAEGWFQLSCSVSGSPSATVTGGPTTFVLDPEHDLVNGESCTLTIFATAVTDQDLEDPPDEMEADVVVSFTPYDVCAQPYTAIPAIQGSGLTAAITGAVTTMGVVVGDYEGASPTLRGFYLQDLTGDGDPATSDGIFVYNASYNNVNVGDVVRVTGTASEYQGQTQINTTAAPIKCDTGSVVPVEVSFPVESDTFLERYEGMLVRLSQTLYVTEHYQLGRFGQVVLSSGGRLMQPTNIYAPGPEAVALQDANNLNRIIVDDALNNQNPDPIVFGRGGLPLSASNTLRGGDTATGIVGVMTYTWGGNSASPNAYRVRPINALGGSINFDSANPRPEAAPALAGSLRVAGMNLLNFFNTFTGCTTGVDGEPTDCRGADTLVEYNRQLPKTVAAITGTMADVVGLVEVENDGYGPDSALATLVDALNAATAPGTYAFIDADAGTGQINALGTDAIKVGLIYKPAKATPIGTTAALNTVDFVNGGDSEARNRPALAQAFEEVATGGRFVVAVNHLKSKTCPGVGSNADQGDGQGCWNEVRTNAANMLWSWLEGDPTQIGDTDALIIGDLNSYAKEDPIEALKDAGYTDLKLHFGSWEAYSYVFDGQWGYLDHALSSYSLTPQVAGVFDWHINADEPSVLDYNTDFKSASQIVSLYATDEFRMSDHDPVLIDLNLTPEMNDSFVTAGGWIDSPAGAYAADPAATGKAFIPFTVKYKKGALAPTGNLQFQLLKSDLNFRSTSFDWLVINQSGTLAQIQGRGVIGKEAYHFMVWVADGEPDAYRIKIWNDEDILYDNGALQPLGAGSIQIHVK